MKTIAITGGIGSGKSTLTKRIEEQGLYVFDADIIARFHFNNNLNKIQSIFGTTDRGKISEIIGSDSFKRTCLETLLHPLVENTIKNLINYHEKFLNCEWLFFEVPLLFETKKQGMYDCTILITCDKEIRQQRLLDSRNMSFEKSDLIMKFQLDDGVKKSLADFVYDNSHTPIPAYLVLNNLKSFFSK